MSVIDAIGRALEPSGPASPTTRRSVALVFLRVLGAFAIPIVAFSVLWSTFDFLREPNANRVLVVVVAIVVGVGGVFFLYWAMNRLVDCSPQRFREGRPAVGLRRAGAGVLLASSSSIR